MSSKLIALAFFFLSNALLLSGLIGYGNDTAHWDIPYRAVASALVTQGDLPLWYPGAGNGFPQLNFQWVSWVANPLGVALAALRPYDYLSLAVENTIWRAIGFGGSYVFARQWTATRVGAVAIAATYVGSGTMAWAALSYSALIGQMFAPWVLAGGSLAIRAASMPHLLRAGGVLGLAAGAMVWCAYPGAWLTAPVISGPVLLGLAIGTRGGVGRLVFAVCVAVVIVGLIVALIASESTSVLLIEGSLVYSRQNAAIREGLLRGIDLAGVLLVNPSYAPGMSSALMHPLYSGTLPLLVLLSSFAPRRVGLATISVVTVLTGLALANFQNWTLWDHPLLRHVDALKLDLSVSANLVLLALFGLPLALLASTWGVRRPLTSVDTAMLFGCGWVILVSGDSAFADLLRFNVPPFVLVRYNHLFFWLVSLLCATVAWRRLEAIVNDAPNPGEVHRAVRAWGPRLLAVGAGALAVSGLVAISTPDAFGPGAPPDGISAMGSPHLVWQATILFVALVAGLIAFRRFRSPGTVPETRIWVALLIASFIAFIVACITGVLIRRAGIHPQTIAVPFSWQLTLDIAHGGFILLVTALLFALSRSQTALRTGMAAIMVLDVSLAVPRYFSDNDTTGAAQPGWPFPPFEAGRTDSLFQPSAAGFTKNEFPAPFTGHAGTAQIYGAFSPPPPVTRLRADWDTLYETWVHFPSTWSLISDADVTVTRDSLLNSARPLGCTAPQKAEPITPAGSVRLLLATTVDVSFTADCDRLLVFTDSWAPGWSASIDGAPVAVLRINNAIRGVMVPAGEHALQWRYRPRFLMPLLALLASGLTIAGILIASPWWTRRFRIPTLQQPNRFFRFGRLPPDEALVPVPAPLGPDTIVPAMENGSPDTAVGGGNRPPALWRYSLPIALPITGIAVLVLVSVKAYDLRFDGPTDGFRLFLLRSVLAGLWAWIVIAGRTGFRSAIGPSIMLLVLLPPLVLQAIRHTFPIQPGTPLAIIATDFRATSWQDTWEVTRRGNAVIETGSSGTILRNEGATATAITATVRSITPDIWSWLRRPLGKVGPGPVDLTWIATVNRSGPYYTVATLGRLTIQALKGGYLITAPVPGGDVTGDFVALQDTGQPRPVRWLLRINPESTATLSHDEQQVWKGGHPGEFKRVTLGDASSDLEHRGTMTLTDASVIHRVSLTTP